jgi:SAM-dependent methyltransferase
MGGVETAGAAAGRTALPSYVVCPACCGDLRRETDDRDDEAYECTACETRFPVVRDVPRFVDPASLPELQSRTADAFGWQWQHFTEMHAEYERQFLDWIRPLQPEDFVGKRVLDAGCGIGRHAFFAARFGAAEVVALDLSEAVETARDNLAGLDGVHVLQGDILRPPFRAGDPERGFDLVYSIGVLHHLPDPRAGFLSLARLVRPGGTMLVWVYGHEGNALVRHVVEPLRRVTTRMSPSLLRAVAWPLSVVLYAASRVVRGPLRRLPSGVYVASLRAFSFRQVYSIGFDQLVAPSSRYIRREELAEWFAAAGLEGVQITQRNGNSWRGRGVRPRLG